MCVSSFHLFLLRGGFAAAAHGGTANAAHAAEDEDDDANNGEGTPQRQSCIDDIEDIIDRVERIGGRVGLVLGEHGGRLDREEGDDGGLKARSRPLGRRIRVGHGPRVQGGGIQHFVVDAEVALELDLGLDRHAGDRLDVHGRAVVRGGVVVSVDGDVRRPLEAVKVMLGEVQRHAVLRRELHQVVRAGVAVLGVVGVHLGRVEGAVVEPHGIVQRVLERRDAQRVVTREYAVRGEVHHARVERVVERERPRLVIVAVRRVGRGRILQELRVLRRKARALALLDDLGGVPDLAVVVALVRPVGEGEVDLVRVDRSVRVRLLLALLVEVGALHDLVGALRVEPLADVGHVGRARVHAVPLALVVGVEVAVLVIRADELAVGDAVEAPVEAVAGERVLEGVVVAADHLHDGALGEEAGVGAAHAARRQPNVREAGHVVGAHKVRNGFEADHGALEEELAADPTVKVVADGHDVVPGEARGFVMIRVERVLAGWVDEIEAVRGVDRGAHADDQGVQRFIPFGAGRVGLVVHDIVSVRGRASMGLVRVGRVASRARASHAVVRRARVAGLLQHFVEALRLEDALVQRRVRGHDK
mmetsp:Transcript_33257/g.76898  ORF Transcript_33257/g.76898 Transcript_33257/m.76898 type:complete len:590 (+) Transcript_33257:216-1985(+)